MNAWYITQSVHKDLPNTPEGRLFGYLPANDDIATINFVFQVWDFIVSWFVPEYCTVLMMCHHAMSALVCFYSIHWQVRCATIYTFVNIFIFSLFVILSLCSFCIIMEVSLNETLYFSFHVH